MKARTSLKGMETILVLTARPRTFPRRPREVYAGASYNNEVDLIGHVIYEPWRTSWMLPYATKRLLFTEAHRIAVGGSAAGSDSSCDEDAGDSANVGGGGNLIEDTCPGIAALAAQTGQGRGAPKTRTDDNVEVVFFHAWPTNLYEELYTSFSMAGVVDMTAGPGPPVGQE